MSNLESPVIIVATPSLRPIETGTLQTPLDLISPISPISSAESSPGQPHTLSLSRSLSPASSSNPLGMHSSPPLSTSVIMPQSIVDPEPKSDQNMEYHSTVEDIVRKADARMKMLDTLHDAMQRELHDMFDRHDGATRAARRLQEMIPVKERGDSAVESVDAMLNVNPSPS